MDNKFIHRQNHRKLQMRYVRKRKNSINKEKSQLLSKIRITTDKSTEIKECTSSELVDTNEVEEESIFLESCSENDDSSSENENDAFESGDDIDNGNTSSESTITKILKDFLRECKPPYSHVDYLLKKLKVIDESLPSSHKTLLKTNSKCKLKVQKFDADNSNDQSTYVYFGISDNLKNIVNTSKHSDGVIQLQFHVDCVSLFKSSQVEFWPILAKVYTNPSLYKPFIVAVWCGNGKPNSVDMYFKEFVEELNHLMHVGLYIKEHHFQVKVMCFICDRPARAFVKCIKGHTGYHSCERCVTSGYRQNNRTLFATSYDDDARTDASFREYTDGKHHIGTSPLLDLKIDMVKDFVLDFMHLGYLGIMKKLIDYWCIMTNKTLLDKTSILRVSRILSCYDLFPKYIIHADAYLKSFVQSAHLLYGENFKVLNLHSLGHLVEDVKNKHCSLEDISAFLFENELGKIKKALRSGNKPLEQLCRKH